MNEGKNSTKQPIKIRLKTANSKAQEDDILKPVKDILNSYARRCSTYKIYDAVKKNKSNIIAVLTLGIAIATSIINMLSFIVEKAKFDYWNISKDFIWSYSKSSFYGIFITVVMILMEYICTTIIAQKTFNYYCANIEAILYNRALRKLIKQTKTKWFLLIKLRCENIVSLIKIRRLKLDLRILKNNKDFQVYKAEIGTAEKNNYDIKRKIKEGIRRNQKIKVLAKEIKRANSWSYFKELFKFITILMSLSVPLFICIFIYNSISDVDKLYYVYYSAFIAFSLAVLAFVLQYNNLKNKTKKALDEAADKIISKQEICKDDTNNGYTKLSFKEFALSDRMIKEIIKTLFWVTILSFVFNVYGVSNGIITSGKYYVADFDNKQYIMVYNNESISIFEEVEIREDKAFVKSSCQKYCKEIDFELKPYIIKKVEIIDKE